MSWLNADGLELRFGTDKVDPAIIGEYRQDGPKRLIELRFTYSDLPLIASNSVLVRDNITIPAGALIESVEIATSVAWDSADDNETFNVGLIDTDRTSNASATALVNAATQTEINTGGTNVAGWVGGSVNTKLTTDKLVTWEINTTQPTAGASSVRIYYSVQ